jgi:ComF family protein
VRVGFEETGDFICSDCSGEEQWVERTFAAGLHAGILRDAIHLFKYQKKALLAKPLARLLFAATMVKLDLHSYDMLAPVPLHRKRLKERGYNQSELLGTHLCGLQKEVGFQPVLRRVKNTPSFSMLKAPERRLLIQKAFEVAPGADVKKKRILLIDDVVTTGATTNECAKTLRKKGAASVHVIALAVVGRL